MREERYKAMALMCRELLDADKPFSWSKNVNEHERDLAIDLLIRSVLGLTEDRNNKENLDYVENNFYGAYYQLTKKFVAP